MSSAKDIFTMETKIPDIVQTRADAAFSSIRMKGADMGRNNKKSFFRKPATFAVAAAVAMLAAGTAFAAANGFWSQGSKAMIQADLAQQQELESIGAAMIFDDSMAVTSDGITVAPREMILDSRIARISFVITGIDEDVLADNSSNISFDNTDFELSGVEPGNWTRGGSFYREVTVEQDGSVNVDPVIEDNGTKAMEFITYAELNSPQDSIIGKTMHVEFDKLGLSFGKAEPVIEFISDGTWEFDIQLNGTDSTVTFEESQVIYEPYTVTSVEISPLSMQVNFDVDGQVELGDDFNVPVVYGLKMKDGTIIDLDSCLEDGKPVFFRDLGKCIYKDGNTYTLDENERLFPESAFSTATFNTVINPDEVAEVILQPWGEAYAWGDDIPDEIIAQEYGGQIPFERIDHSNMELYYIPINQ